MTAPRAGRDDATLRGAIVLVVAIVIGLALLARSGGGGSEEAATTTEASTTSAAFDGSTTASDSVPGPINSETTTSSVPEGPGDTRAPADVVVLVLNGTTANVEGVAGDNDDKLKSAGFTTLNATGADVDLTTTTIYADAEFQADAEAVRNILGMPDAVIEPKPAESPGTGADDADVVVVLGDDVA